MTFEHSPIISSRQACGLKTKPVSESWNYIQSQLHLGIVFLNWSQYLVPELCAAPCVAGSQTWNKKLGVLHYPGAHSAHGKASLPSMAQHLQHLDSLSFSSHRASDENMGKEERMAWGWRHTYFHNPVNVLTRIRGMGSNPSINASKISASL